MNYKIKIKRDIEKRKRHSASKEILQALIDTNKSIKSICYSHGFGDVSVFDLMNSRYIQNKKAIEKATK